MRCRASRRRLQEAMGAVNASTPLTDDERASLAALDACRWPTEAPEGLLESLQMRGYVESRMRPHRRTGEVVRVYAISAEGKRALERGW